MRKIIVILLVLSSWMTLTQAQIDNSAFVAPIPMMAIAPKKVEIIKLADLERIIRSDNDTTYVINFWATWCVPCVKEFPSFQKLAQAHNNEKVKVVMISLDFKKGYLQTLVPFVNKHPIKGLVYLLDEPDYNSWINKVSPDWQGEIPVTLMINKSKKLYAFFNHDFTPKELEDTFTKTIKQ